MSTTNCGCGSAVITGSHNIPEHIPCDAFEAVPEFPVESDPQPECVIDSKQVVYKGSNIPGLGITTGMKLPAVLTAINAALSTYNSNLQSAINAIVLPKEYIVRIGQSGTGNPIEQVAPVNTLPTGYTVTYTRLDVGLYRVRFGTGTTVVNGNNVLLNFTGTSVTKYGGFSQGAVGPNNHLDYEIETRDAAGALADSLLLNTFLHIRLL